MHDPGEVLPPLHRKERPSGQMKADDAMQEGPQVQAQRVPEVWSARLGTLDLADLTGSRCVEISPSRLPA